MLVKALAPVSVAARSVGASLGGMWQAVRAYVQGRQARLFERERRATLQIIPQTLLPGIRIYDRRADGSVLEVHIPPPTQMKVAVEGHAASSLGVFADDQRRASIPLAADCCGTDY